MSCLLAKQSHILGLKRIAPMILTRGKKDSPPINKKMRRNQEKFQVESPCPVFLKGGALDQILYRTTLGLCIGSLGYQTYFYASTIFGF